jgi:dihydroorotate dehydrogenase electron transfer subunit
MSVYGANPATEEAAFLYKITGAGTLGLATLAPGDTLNIVGPLGCGFTLHQDWRSIVAVGCGAGLATLGPLAQLAQTRGIAVTAIRASGDSEPSGRTGHQNGHARAAQG